MPAPGCVTRALKVERGILTQGTRQEASGQPAGQTLETPGDKAGSRPSIEALVPFSLL